MQNKIALIAISNGLGHLRRQLILYRYLLEQGEEVTLFCNIDDLRKLTTDGEINAKNLIIRVSELAELSSKGFFKKLRQSLEPFDIVLSDNCIEVLEARPDSFLFSSFFWHRTLKMPHDYIEKCESLLSTHKPIIFADSLFKAPYLRDIDELIEVNMFGSPYCDVIKKNELLISFGFGHSINNTFLEFASRAIRVASEYNYHTWIEPRYFQKLSGKNVSLATYNRDMYAGSKFGLVRPGIGTLTEMIASNSFAIMLYENNNSEMSYNASVMVSLGCGIDITNENRFEELLSDYFSESRNTLTDFTPQFTGPMDIYREWKKFG